MRLSIALLATMILRVASAQQPAGQPPCLLAGGVPVEQTLASCTELIEGGALAPDNLAAVYLTRGGIYFDKRDFDRAIADFDQAIALDPKSSRSYNARGRAYQGKLDYDRAVADFDDAIALDPAYAAPFNNRGNLYRSKGQLIQVTADQNQRVAVNVLSRIDPKHPPTE